MRKFWVVTLFLFSSFISSAEAKVCFLPSVFGGDGCLTDEQYANCEGFDRTSPCPTGQEEISCTKNGVTYYKCYCRADSYLLSEHPEYRCKSGRPVSEECGCAAEDIECKDDYIYIGDGFGYCASYQNARGVDGCILPNGQAWYKNCTCDSDEFPYTCYKAGLVAPDGDDLKCRDTSGLTSYKFCVCDTAHGWSSDCSLRSDGCSLPSTSVYSGSSTGNGYCYKCEEDTCQTTNLLNLSTYLCGFTSSSDWNCSNLGYSYAPAGKCPVGTDMVGEVGLKCPFDQDYMACGKSDCPYPDKETCEKSISGSTCSKQNGCFVPASCQAAQGYVFNGETKTCEDIPCGEGYTKGLVCMSDVTPSINGMSGGEQCVNCDNCQPNTNCVYTYNINDASVLTIDGVNHYPIYSGNADLAEKCCNGYYKTCNSRCEGRDLLLDRDSYMKDNGYTLCKACGRSFYIIKEDGCQDGFSLEDNHCTAKNCDAANGYNTLYQHHYDCKDAGGRYEGASGWSLDIEMDEFGEYILNGELKCTKCVCHPAAECIYSEAGNQGATLGNQCCDGTYQTCSMTGDGWFEKPEGWVDSEHHATTTSACNGQYIKITNCDCGYKVENNDCVVKECEGEFSTYSQEPGDCGSQAYWDIRTQEGCSKSGEDICSKCVCPESVDQTCPYNDENSGGGALSSPCCNDGYETCSMTGEGWFEKPEGWSSSANEQTACNGEYVKCNEGFQVSDDNSTCVEFSGSCSSMESWLGQEDQDICDQYPDVFSCYYVNGCAVDVICNINNGYVDLDDGSDMTGFDVTDDATDFGVSAAGVTCTKIYHCDWDHGWTESDNELDYGTQYAQVTDTRNLGTYLACHQWGPISCEEFTGESPAYTPSTKPSNLHCLNKLGDDDEYCFGNGDFEDCLVCYSDCYTCQGLWNDGEIEGEDFEDCTWIPEDHEWDCTGGVSQGSVILDTSEITSDYDCYAQENRFGCHACQLKDCNANEIPLENGYTCPIGTAREARPSVSCCKKCCTLARNPSFASYDWIEYDSDGCAYVYADTCATEKRRMDAACNPNIDASCEEFTEEYERCLARSETELVQHKAIIRDCVYEPLVSACTPHSWESNCGDMLNCETDENGCYISATCYEDWDGDKVYPEIGPEKLSAYYVLVGTPDIYGEGQDAKYCYPRGVCRDENGWQEDACGGRVQLDYVPGDGDTLPSCYKCSDECIHHSWDEYCDAGELDCETDEDGCYVSAECSPANGGVYNDKVYPSIGPKKLSTYYDLGDPEIYGEGQDAIYCYSPTHCNTDNGWREESCGSGSFENDHVEGEIENGMPNCYKCGDCDEANGYYEGEDEDEDCPTGFHCEKDGGCLHITGCDNSHMYFEHSSTNLENRYDPHYHRGLQLLCSRWRCKHEKQCDGTYPDGWFACWDEETTTATYHCHGKYDDCTGVAYCPYVEFIGTWDDWDDYLDILEDEEEDDDGNDGFEGDEGDTGDGDDGSQNVDVNEDDDHGWDASICVGWGCLVQEASAYNPNMVDETCFGDRCPDDNDVDSFNVDTGDQTGGGDGWECEDCLSRCGLEMVHLGNESPCAEYCQAHYCVGEGG